MTPGYMIHISRWSLVMDDHNGEDCGWNREEVY